MSPRRWIHTPKAITIGMLLVLAAVNAPYTSVGAARVFWTLLVPAAAASVVEFALGALRGWGVIRPDGAIITALIIAMTIDARTPAWRVAVLAGAATIVKHAIRVKRGPVFNPAALALVPAALAPALGLGHQDWWAVAAAPQYLAIPALVITGLVAADSANRLPLAGQFLAAFYIAMFLLLFVGEGSRIAEAYHAPFLDATLFAALVMLTDPPTSPARRIDQRDHAVLVAVATALTLAIVHQVSYLPVALLIGNAALVLKPVLKRLPIPRTTNTA